MSNSPKHPDNSSDNPVATYFEAHKEGPGIWKWRHYFDIYHRHFGGLSERR